MAVKVYDGRTDQRRQEEKFGSRLTSQKLCMIYGIIYGKSFVPSAHVSTKELILLSIPPTSGRRARAVITGKILLTICPLLAHGCIQRTRFSRFLDDMPFSDIPHYTGRSVLFPVITALLDDENVEPAREDEAGDGPQEQKVADDETHDVQGVGGDGVEAGVSQTEDDREDGAGDVAEAWSPDDREGPLLAADVHDGVEVVAELIALMESVSEEIGECNGDLLTEYKARK